MSVRDSPGGGEHASRSSVASRVLSVLAAFETTTGALSLTEIAESTGLPLATAHRLVKEMAGWGALERHPTSGRYRVGMRLWEVAQNAGRQLRDAARPYLQDLHSLTGETAHLAVREGDEALYIDRLYSSTRVPRASRVGGRLPLHATAVGKVLLASEEAWFQEAYVHGELARPTRYTHVQPDKLLGELAMIRQRGWATTVEEVRPGSCSIAVPVGQGSQAAASIGLVMLSTRAGTMERHLPAMRGIADRIERAAGRWLPIGRGPTPVPPSDQSTRLPPTEN